MCLAGLAVRVACGRSARVGSAGGVQDLGARCLDGRGVAVADVGGGVQAEAAVMMVVVVPAEEFLAVRPGPASGEGNRAGNAGRYFMVLNCASEYGLSSETCGREWDWADARHVGASALVWLSCRAGEPVRMGPDRGRLPLLGKTVWMCRELTAG